VKSFHGRCNHAEARIRMRDKRLSQLYRTTDIFRIANEIVKDEEDDFPAPRFSQNSQAQNRIERVNSKEVLHTLDLINTEERLPRTVVTDLITPHRSYIFPSHVPLHHHPVAKKSEAKPSDTFTAINDEISRKILRAERLSRSTKFPESRKNYLFAPKTHKISLNVQIKPEADIKEDELADKFRNKGKVF